MSASKEKSKYSRSQPLWKESYFVANDKKGKYRRTVLPGLKVARLFFSTLFQIIQHCFSIVN
jgi:hypothetical protein